MKTKTSTAIIAATLGFSVLGGILLSPTAASAQAHGRYGSDQDRGRSQERYQDRDDRDHPRDDGWYRDSKGKWKQDKSKRKANKNNKNDRYDQNNRRGNDRYDRDDRYDKNDRNRYPNGGYNRNDRNNGGGGYGGYGSGGYGNGGYNNGGGYGQAGNIIWRGSVDDVVEVYFQAGRSWTRRISGNETQNSEARFSRALPRYDRRLSLTKNEGRGVAFVRQQPSSSNNYTTIVRVEDKDAGAGNYRITLNWN